MLISANCTSPFRCANISEVFAFNISTKGDVTSSPSEESLSQSFRICFTAIAPISSTVDASDIQAITHTKIMSTFHRRDYIILLDRIHQQYSVIHVSSL